MKFFVLLLSFTHILFSFSIDESLLKIHSTLVPKMPLMDYKLKEKTRNNSIVIAIFYNPNDYKDASLLQKLIDLRYDEGIGSYNIKTKLVSYLESSNVAANMYYLFPATTSKIKKVLHSATRNKALTFSYSQKELKQGVMLSVLVDLKVRPILNLKAIKSSDITFRPVLLDISQIYKNEDSN